MISGKTKVYAILGDPIAQALSPIVHNAAFAAANKDCVFLGLQVSAGELKAAFEGLKALHFAGLALTMPLKKEIIPLLDQTDPWAFWLEAVNVVVKNSQDQWIGYNTDGDGFTEGLARAGVCLEGKEVFLFGAGGAARSIAASLAKKRVSRLTICNIVEEDARRLIDKINGDTATKADFAGFSAQDAAKPLLRADVVVNATSLGMRGNPSPHVDFVPWDSLKRSAVFAEAVHKPLLTPFLQAAGQHGHKIVTGDQMNLYQGVLAYQLWTGTPAPVSEMENALRQWLAQEQTHAQE